MLIKNIKAINFRNYNILNLNFDASKALNIIHSPNGMGKSNLLEIIYYCTYLRSFRSVLDREIIKKNENFFQIELTYKNKNLLNSIKIKYDKKKVIFFNEKRIIKYSEIFGKFIAVFFGNEDIFIINGAPEIKRKFFDIFISVIDKKYLFYLRKYLFILKQKNFLLKQKKDKNLISVYNQQLGYIILYIQKKRIELVERINKVFKEKYSSISLNKNEEVKIEYTPSTKNYSDNEEDIIEFLEKNINLELSFGYSLYGIHRDNYNFLINGIHFSKYASFGQMRLAALVLKFVQAEMFRQIFNCDPVLLLDDVILELDKQRQKRFIECIMPYKQIFITFSDKENINLFCNKEYLNEIELEYGKVKENRTY